MPNYVLNHNKQSNGDNEVHTKTCAWSPSQNYEELGYHAGCKDAVKKAKSNHPSWKINGCYHCCKECHTS